MIYNVVVFAIQQSESAIHIHVSTSLTILFPCRSYRVLSRVPGYSVGSFVVNKLLVTKGEGEMKWELEIDIYTPVSSFSALLSIITGGIMQDGCRKKMSVSILYNE